MTATTFRSGGGQPIHSTTTALVRAAGCGYAVLLLGLLTTTRWAKATAARLT